MAIRLLLDKKAISIAGMIGTVLAVFVLIMIGTNLQAAVPDKEDGYDCHILMGLKKTQQGVTGDDSSYQIATGRCRTLYSEVPGDHEISNSKQMQELFAMEIEHAWWMVHEGSVKYMWDQREWRITEPEKVCIILKTINYPMDEDLTYTASKSEFFGFLLDHIAVEEDDGSTWTYIEYIQSYGKNPAVFRFQPDGSTGEDFLIPGEEYAVAVESGDGDWSFTDHPNTVLFGTLDDILAYGCGISISEEVA